MEFEKSMAVTIKGIQNVSREVSSAAEQVAASSNDLADGATNQAAVVEELTATVAGVSEQVEQNSESAKKIMRNPLLLGKISGCNRKDKQVVTAAKMIGVKKNIIVVAAGPFQFAMINPVITRKSGAFETEEGCLSLDGVRSCTRYEEIEVDHCNGIVI